MLPQGPRCKSYLRCTSRFGKQRSWSAKDAVKGEIQRSWWMSQMPAEALDASFFIIFLSHGKASEALQTQWLCIGRTPTCSAVF